MDKSSDTVEASTSKKNTNISSRHSSQFISQIKGEYHVKYSDDEDSPKNNSTEVEMNNSRDLHTTSENTSDSDNLSSMQDEQAVSDDDNEALVSQAKQRSNRHLQLLKWQTWQVAKAAVDNTINCVLEDLGFRPLNVETEDIIRDGNLEHEAVSMAILSHGLQRSVHDTCTTSSQVDSTSSHQSFKNVSSPFHFLVGLPSEKKVQTAQDTLTPYSQMGASSSSSSSRSVYQNGDMVFDVLSEADQTIIQSDNVMTAEHSKPHCTEALHVQSQNNSLHHDGVFTHTQADCDVVSSFGVKAHNKLPTEPCACSLSSNAVKSPQRDDLSSPFHKRKAEDFTEISKRSCQESSSSLTDPELAHPPLKTASSEESVSNVQILYDKVPSFEHFDFMDAAVAVAIQKKGLSAMACTEYG